jgi:hypothetical protein
MPGAENLLATFDYSVQVDGLNLACAAFVVTIGINDIPTIKCTIDPFHLKGTPVKRAMDPELSYYFNKPIPRQLNSTLKKPKENSQVEITMQGKGRMNQKISASNWVLDGVSYDSVSASEAGGLTITLKHPVVLADRSYTCLVGSSSENSSPVKIPTGDLFTVATSLMQTYVDKASTDGSILGDSGASSVLKHMKQRLATSVDKLKQHMQWEGGSLSLSGVERDVYCSLWSNIAGSSALSPFGLMRSICLMFNACIGPKNLSDPLVAMPASPWGNVDFTIDDSDIQDLQINPSDVRQASGLYAIFSPYATSGSHPLLMQGDKKKYTASKLWIVPKGIEDSERDPNGTIKQAEFPAWLNGLVYGQQKAAYAQWLALLNKAGTPGINAPDLAKPKDLTYVKKSTGEVINKYLESTLQMQHRADHTAAIRCRAMFTSGGKPVRPGVVAAITHSGELFYIYVTKVTHVLSKPSSAAYTVIEGSHYRTGEGGLFDLTPAKGKPNVMYK